jgi:hypothetical protein
MTESDEAKALTELLLGTIRLQRHLGARVFISGTKDISKVAGSLLGYHRPPVHITRLASFAEATPGWRILTSKTVERATRTDSTDEKDVLQGLKALSLDADKPILSLFSKILALRVGEALVFAPSAKIGVAGSAKDSPAEARLVSLGHGVLMVRIRNRLTKDGGKSVFAK